MPSAWALNSRQGAAAERRACAREKRTCAQEAERSEIKVFWGAFFSKKVRPCPYRRAAQERKLGKQGLCPAFPGRRSARKVASQKLGREPAVCPLRPPLEGTSPKGGGETWLSLRESWHGAAVTERASCQPHRPLPWLSPLRARAPRSLVSFWLTPHKVKGKVEAFLKKSFTKKL